MTIDNRYALVASPTEEAQAAEAALRERHSFSSMADAEAAIVLGGDGFMLQTLHQMLSERHILPVFGMNLGTVGFSYERMAARWLGRATGQGQILHRDAITDGCGYRRWRNCLQPSNQ